MRKKRGKEVSTRKSIIQVHKTFASCCSDRTTCNPIQSCVSSTSSEMSATNMTIASLDNDQESEEKKILLERILKLETELAELRNIFEVQQETNSAALKDFYDLKTECATHFTANENVPSSVENSEENNSFLNEIQYLKEKVKEISEKFDDFSSVKKTVEPKVEFNENQKITKDDSKSKIEISISRTTSSLHPKSVTSSVFSSSAPLSTACANSMHNSEAISSSTSEICVNENNPCDDDSQSNYQFCNPEQGCENQNFEHFQMGNGDEMYEEVKQRSNAQCCDGPSKYEKNLHVMQCWIEKILHELSMRPSRKEFEVCKEQIWKLIRVVSKIRQHEKTSSGIVLPLIKNWTPSYSSMNTSCYMPKLQCLKYGRQCNQQNLRRGSHTKLLRANQIRSMRYKRIATPVKICSSLLVCKGFRN